MFGSDRDDEDSLRERWLDLAARFTADHFGVEATWHALHSCYTEPQRKYHTLDHIAALLRLADAERAHAVHPEVLEFAIWFHDAVYDPHARDNEQRSAAWARRTLEAMRVDSSLTHQVEACILATQTHELPDTAIPDLPLFLDLDLAILAAPEADYDAYCSRIRAEYAWVPEPEYRVQRAAVLERFAARPKLFFTPHLAARFETPARNNIARELRALLAS